MYITNYLLLKIILGLSHYQLKYYEILKASDIGHSIAKRGIHPSNHHFNKVKEVSFKALGR